jgi:uncharacterized protein YdeI (YjbR/CyaY-like superfamily)
MTKTATNPKVDAYIARQKNRQSETEALRAVLLGCGLDEDLKWGKPCYSHADNNVAIIQGFKKYFALLFFKGVLLKDPDHILLKTGENTNVGRQIRFTDAKEITNMKNVLKKYIQQAIEIEKEGLKVEVKKMKELKFPEELQNKFDKNTSFKNAFNALTPGRQRGYVFYFSAPRQSKTRESRIEKCLQQILDGKGLND